MKVVIVGFGYSPSVAHTAKLAIEACLSIPSVEIVVKDDFRPVYVPIKAFYKPDNLLKDTTSFNHNHYHQIGNQKKNRRINLINCQNYKNTKRS